MLHPQYLAPSGKHFGNQNARFGKLIGDHSGKLFDDHVVNFFVDIHSSGLNETVRQLNTAKVLPPMEYAKSNGLEGNYSQGTGLWNARSVKKILTNCVYVGDLMQGKQNYLVKDVLEALVDRETFARIQWGFSKSAEASKEKAKPASDNPFKGKVICGCCSGKMQRRKGSGNAD